MLRLLTDENVNHLIVRGLRARLPGFDCVVVQEAGLAGSTDEKLLEIAANAGRVLITHDAKTMTAHAYDRIVKGVEMPGVIVVPNNLNLGHAIEDLEILIQCESEENLRHQVRFIPI